MLLEDTSKLTSLEYSTQSQSIQDLTNQIADVLRNDHVILLHQLDGPDADRIIFRLADRLGLSTELKLQSNFAGLFGHRRSVSDFFMTVNLRDAYQFVTPHSEGGSRSRMELAAFHCRENSTDGGYSILLNAQDSSTVWPSLREQVKRVKLKAKVLTSAESLRAKGQYRVSVPEDLVKTDDLVLSESPTDIPGLFLVDVLAKVTQSYSRILNKNTYVYWDTVASIDFDSAKEYHELLTQATLLRQPLERLDISKLDAASARRVWSSGVRYDDLFSSKLTVRLAPGDLLIQNNMSWTHSATNWTPGSGVRHVIASFA